MLVFVTASAIIGIGAQLILPNGIGLSTEVLVVGSDSNSAAIPFIAIDPNGNGDTAENISLDDAFVAYQSGTALFLDARSQADFQKGHILGAVNIPIHAFLDSLPYLEQVDQLTHLITYCDGADCNASIELARDLKMMGFPQVSFFFGGWQAWLSVNYPTEGPPE